MNALITGVHSAVATPVAPDGSIATDLFLDHCRALLDEGCHGLAPLGTTGEAINFGCPKEWRRSIQWLRAA